MFIDVQACINHKLYGIQSVLCFIQRGIFVLGFSSRQCLQFDELIILLPLNFLYIILIGNFFQVPDLIPLFDFRSSSVRSFSGPELFIS